MKKELKYVAPEVEVLSAQVEKGVYASPGAGGQGGGNWGDPDPWQ